MAQRDLDDQAPAHGGDDGGAELDGGDIRLGDGGRRLSLPRILLGAVVILALIGVAIGYTVHTAHQDSAAAKGSSQSVGALPLVANGPPTLLVRDEQPGPDLGRVATVPLSDPQGPRTVGDVSCDRVYEASGTILCLYAERGVTSTNWAYIYDRSWHKLDQIQVAGVPNRARISADGHIASWTVFVTGDSYAAASFSTRTSILDVRTGKLYASLETFTVHMNGQVYRSPDINFWGVTVAADDDTFYATMKTQGQTYLVKGSISQQSVTTLRTNVECPSLSPDGTRIVFKKKVSDDVRKPWHLYVLNLATMQETPLAESRSVDDQADWLNNDTVGYSLPSATDTTGDDIWEVPADGTGTPKLLIHDAFSPALVS